MISEPILCQKFLELSGAERVISRFIEHTAITSQLDEILTMDRREARYLALEAMEESRHLLGEIFMICSSVSEPYYQLVINQIMQYNLEMQELLLEDFEVVATRACGHFKWLLSIFYCNNQIIRHITPRNSKVEIFGWCIGYLRSAIDDCFLGSEDATFNTRYLLFIGQWTHVNRILKICSEEVASSTEVYDGLLYDMRFTVDLSVCCDLGYNAAPESYLAVGVTLFTEIARAAVK